MGHKAEAQEAVEAVEDGATLALQSDLVEAVGAGTVLRVRLKVL